ncbi:MAG: phosphoglycerate kinase [Candidatus ainarchaeum sp.]|nr:phosphoglycerate kinase [Candidatus ainarchaeum sp.]
MANDEDGFRTMRDFSFKGKRVLVRCDFNSPLGPNGEPLEFMRIRVYRPTFAALKDAAKVVVISHQGRKGQPDCVSLAKHAEILGQTIDTHKVIFCDDLIGPKALAAIDAVKPGEILVLENTRFLDEDAKNAPAEENAKTTLVKTLAPKFDVFINDAFSVSHRSQPSVTGFPVLVPSCAGMVVEKEMDAMYRAVEKGRRPSVYVVGGNKLSEVVKVIETTLYANTVDKILLGGAVAYAFLNARGLAPPETLSVITEKGEDLEKLLKRIKTIDSLFRERIETPVDIAISRGGREEVLVTDAKLKKYPPNDIGEKTISIYTEEIMRARSVLSKGPMGMYENPTFLQGTVKILMAMEHSKAYSLIGGGHMGNIAFDLGIAVDHISTAGGAVLAFMSGEKLPGIEVLRENAKKFPAA